jgi:chorismate-pyruvate lyase
MFEQWSLTDVLAAAAGAVAVTYLGFELSRRQRKLRELFNVLDGADASLTRELSDLVDSGVLRPYSAVAAG